jgi:puromycin-sensitive aminopeptidase
MAQCMSEYRLPSFFIPSAYAIDLDASPARSTFTGVVTITGKLSSLEKKLELNARNIAVKRAVAIVGAKKVTLAAKTNKQTETLSLTAKSPLPKGKVTLVISYQGKLDPAMHGLYLAKEGRDRSLVSQCEATDARAIFPCLDEPSFKATLEWTVRTEPGLTVVTNGVPKSVKKAKGKAVHTFKATRVVSTYLAAVTIGAYEASKTDRVSGIPCRVFSAVGKGDQTTFARDVTRFVLPWYEGYFAQKYHYQKLDQVAVSGFDAGAMENIGAIFYRQSRLLMQPGETSWAAEKSIAEVVAHEIAHQWFGNRVTMRWWDDLWLNEAFATWVAFKAIDEWKPAWRMWDDYQEEKESALFADALVSTHPIYTPVKSPAEATELFDVITYSKGGAMLRMLENYLGKNVFRTGMRKYMDAFKDGNASGADLWLKLEEASGEPVSELMSTWVMQPGFPLLTVEQSGSGESLHLSQRRFYLSGDEMSRTHEADVAWPIPVVIRYGTVNGVKEKRVLMRDKTLDVALEEKPLWVYPNAHAIGFYRMHLSDEVQQALLKHGLKSLAPAERLSVLEDSWALVRNATIDISEFMDVFRAFSGEKDYAVVRALAGRANMLDQRLVKDEDRPKFAAFVGKIFQPVLDEIGLTPKQKEGPETSSLRATLVDILGHVGNVPAVVAFAREQAGKERANPQSVEPNLAETVVGLAAHAGDAATLDAFVSTYKARVKGKTTPELQARYLGALHAFQGTKLSAKVLALLLDGTVPQESLRSVLSPMLSSRHCQMQAWAFLKKEWKKIGPRIGAMGISRLVEATGALPPSQEKDVQAFFKKNPVPEAVRALKKALEAMALTKDLQAREGARLSAWLNEL